MNIRKFFGKIMENLWKFDRNFIESLRKFNGISMKSQIKVFFFSFIFLKHLIKLIFLKNYGKFMKIIWKDFLKV